MTAFPESHLDLLQAKTAILSTVGSTGIPQTTAIWFLFDGDELHSWLSDARQKVKNLLARPEFSLFILDLENPAATSWYAGAWELTPDTECVFGDKMGEKYGVDMRAMLRRDEIRYRGDLPRPLHGRDRIAEGKSRDARRSLSCERGAELEQPRSRRPLPRRQRSTTPGRPASRSAP